MLTTLRLCNACNTSHTCRALLIIFTIYTRQVTDALLSRANSNLAGLAHQWKHSRDLRAKSRARDDAESAAAASPCTRY